jgi:hypothetical protein
MINCVYRDHTTLQLEFKNHYRITMLQLLFDNATPLKLHPINTTITNHGYIRGSS